MKIVIFLFILSVNQAAVSKEKQASLPPKDAFVSLHDVDASIPLDMRYYDTHNFVGQRIRGYKANKCLLTRQTARSLNAIQKELKKKALSLKIYDCYRPQRAVDHFVKWAKDLSNTRMKKEFYPSVEKKNLFKDGYIASRSGHSRGSTVDLTFIVDPPPPQADIPSLTSLVSCTEPYLVRYQDNSVDMGTGFDCFDPLSNTFSHLVGKRAQRNRHILRTIMVKHGFKYYDKEWWHFTLRKEPFPKTYFDFEVE